MVRLKEAEGEPTAPALPDRQGDPKPEHAVHETFLVDAYIHRP